MSFKFFNEEFEYMRHNLHDPSNKEFKKLHYSDEEYKTLEWHRVYSRMLLDELGSRGWELVASTDDSHEKDVSVERLTFKRSSRSKYYKTGFGVDIAHLSDLAKEEAEELTMKTKNEDT